MPLDTWTQQLDSPVGSYGQCTGSQFVGEEDVMPRGDSIVLALFSQESRKGIPQFGEARLVYEIDAHLCEATLWLELFWGECDPQLDYRKEESLEGDLELQPEIFRIIWQFGIAHEDSCMAVQKPGATQFFGARENRFCNGMANFQVTQSRGPRIHEGGDVVQSLAPDQLNEENLNKLLASVEGVIARFGMVATYEIEGFASGAHRSNRCRRPRKMRSVTSFFHKMRLL